VNEKNFARRAAALPTTFPAPHFPSEMGADTKIFDSAFAAPELLPDLAELASKILSDHKEELLQYSPTQGQPYLREWIAEYLTDDGCAGIGPNNILITNGAKHALDLICRLLLDEGDLVAVTAPTYFTMLPIFRSFGVRFIEVSQDTQGIIVDDLSAHFRRLADNDLPLPKIVYDIPEFHNPSGVTTSRERREKLIELCGRHDVLIVEDSPYRRVRFTGDDIPSYKALDTGDNVLQVGTVSKLIAPGLRIGWVAAHEQFITRLIALKSDGGTSALLQRLVYEFCMSPAFRGHQPQVSSTYHEKCDRMVVAFRREIPEAEILPPDGGYCLWVKLPEGKDGDLLTAKACAADINIFKGSLFFANAPVFPENRTVPKNFIRLSYSYATFDEIDEGVRVIGEIYRAL